MRSNHDYFQLVKEAKKNASVATQLGQLADHVQQAGAPAPASTVRIALLGDCATQHFLPLLRALFRRQNVAVEIYEAGFDAIELDAYNENSGLYRFQPDFVVILNAVQSLRDKFYDRKTGAEVFLQQAKQRLTGVWDAVKKHSTARILQSNYVLPVESTFGNYDLKVPFSLRSVVEELNHFLVLESRSRSHVLVSDVEALASWAGRSAWFDERLWTVGKSFCALDQLPMVAGNVVEMVMAARGRLTKCIVLDLDNTLWGGVVGDDGPLGIQISAHGAGEAFYRFQCYLRELKNRGLLLAVCSKNEPANAVRPFQENPEMVLRLSDFSAFVANWNNKADNIRQIRETLNIGLDSIVFLDDNPFERNLVRTMAPEVTVPEMPEDPSEYTAAVASLNLFETASYSAEDSLRTELYAREAQRKMAEQSASSFEEYLQSLEMTIEVSRFTAPQLPRIAQLLQRSNQFNLTTHRYSEAECETLMNDREHAIPLFAKLRDRFGDHGLISIVVARPRPEAGVLELVDWLMSCRVLSRGVEEYLMNHVMAEARSRGLARVSGRYIPTAKNAMVQDFYGRFGFRKTAEEPDGSAAWEIEVAEYQPRTVYISGETAAAAAV